ncbi:hypothetical protein [Rivularia sp. UHCC 0363]|uniref:hypothetical protein n=1 Tax=Rivularia sp. UHCC 0363 TaxID=3110244 RepID=UPI002B1F3B66|nr:hypothetical protein [Rivularia sp. UHCC 0363]MEA5597168.1 hypothetical protein [Rivularia sp. UHCC 0363]
MSNRNPNSRNHWLVIIGGILLVLLTNCVLSFLGLYGLGAIIAQIFPSSGYNALAIGFTGVWLYQLVYVIPLILSCKRRRQFALMKGVIIGAVITALIAGFCFVQVVSYVIPSK